MKMHKGRMFYGSVTVSDKGQIVIPADARRDFGISIGDKLLVVGELDKGIGLMKASVITGMMADLLDLFHSNTESAEDGKAQ